jgi:predicted amidophosphoribosyltransferase
MHNECNFWANSLLLLYPAYTGCLWKTRHHFRGVFCARKQRKMSVNMGPWTLCFQAMALKIIWLKPAVFFIYGGHLKSTVYATAFNDAVELQRRIEDWCKLIRYTSGIFKLVRQSLMRSAARCVEAKGRHFEHFL